MISLRRNLALLVGACLILMGSLSSTAMAATEVRDAETGELCPPVSPAINTASPMGALISPPKYESGGCTVKISADANSTVVGGYNSCEITYDIHIGPDGWGYADNFVYTSRAPMGCLFWKTIRSVLAPPEAIGPTIPSLPKALFPQSNAATDFYTYWTARTGTGKELSGWLSFDVKTSDAAPEYPFRMDNQATTGNFIGGQWYGGPELTITH